MPDMLPLLLTRFLCRVLCRSQRLTTAAPSPTPASPSQPAPAPWPSCGLTLSFYRSDPSETLPEMLQIAWHVLPFMESKLASAGLPFGLSQTLKLTVWFVSVAQMMKDQPELHLRFMQSVTAELANP